MLKVRVEVENLVTKRIEKVETKFNGPIVAQSDFQKLIDGIFIAIKDSFNDASSTEVRETPES